MKIAESTDGPNSNTIANRLLAYGETLRVLDRHLECLASFERSLKIREENNGKDSLRVAVALNYMGLAYGDLEKTSDAENCYRKAISICESHINDSDFDIEDLHKPLINLAGIVEDAGDFIEAENLFLRAFEITEKSEKQKVKPQLSVICANNFANFLVRRNDFVRAEKYFKVALAYLTLFPENHPFQEMVREQYAIFLCKIHKLNEAMQNYSQSIIDDSTKWGSGDNKKQPERRLRDKLRIIESTIKLNLLNTNPEAVPSEIRKELESVDIKTCKPLLLYGITVKDSQNLSLDFLFDNGDEKISSALKQNEYQEIIQFFLTSIAIDSTNQWVKSDGTMPLDIKGTMLSSELLSQAVFLSHFLSFAIDSSTSCGKAFRQETSQIITSLSENQQEFLLEVWVRPFGASIYTGELTGDLARFGNKGENSAIMLKASFELFWEWRIPLNNLDSNLTDKVISSLNFAFETHILPIINKSLIDGQLFKRLRQINYCLFLAHWFKSEYRFHPNVAKFLESGNPNQLNPRLLNISSLKDNKVEAGQINTSITETTNWGHGIDLNNNAIEMRKQGKIDEAVRLHREALQFDEELRGSNDPKIPHRLNNLSIALIMQENFDEAKQLLERAWSLKTNAHDQTSLRLLFIQTCASFLESNSSELFIGRLKTLLFEESLPNYADLTKTWDIADFIIYLSKRLPVTTIDFLHMLVAAFNDRSKISDLERFSFWQNSNLVPLDKNSNTDEK
jgi:tetratricopeptide (TPR) repeat protein